ncbi:dGTPase [Sporobacter termitidis DSM 10068]|uniref:dGTPase n=1 Tax=Sporobacter termitidis DSM 10068 TaxID=1123282 RepID=A0A1M5YEL3_9FIRM|nr:dNTP triphosphohydrolase [Sporobacter termitidis]SHI10344.1 dGTPase [Sporobacter termitidis DSM 10068]
MSEFIMVKAKDSLPSLRYLEESYIDNGAKRHFNITSEPDRAVVRDLADKIYPTYFLVFSELDGVRTVKYIYIGEGIKAGTAGNPSIEISILQKIANKSMLDNFLSCSEIDLTQDFERNSYITIENLPSLVRQMNFIAKPPYKNDDVTQVVEYPSIDEEDTLHSLAQRNEYCLREYSYPNTDNSRGEFQRDYDRIIHSKSFRRMVDKAQIFSADKGDHYRTRMTHSIAVSQIAKSISKALKLNEALTDAIALGHDIGHTPFGHQGERTLNEILTGKKALLRDVLDKGVSYGGFKHNYHSLKVVTRLEEKYVAFDGLNLSYQTLDGIWKHTKTNLTDDSLSHFISSQKLNEYLIIEKAIPSTLEGQVVKMADEIAQRSHDLEDAFAAQRLSIEEIKNYLMLSKMNELKVRIDAIEDEFIQASELNRFYADQAELLHGRISSAVIDFFVKDVIAQSKTNLDDFLASDGLRRFRDAEHRVQTILIFFSIKAKKLCDYLEKIISKKVINSAEVSLFDSNGASIVESLFTSYYNNPRLLHRGTLHRIMQDFRKITKNVIDFEESDPSIIELEWKKIATATAGEEDDDLAENEYLEKNKLLVGNIADFIAGMTDSYAMNEYNRIRR